MRLFQEDLVPVLAITVSAIFGALASGSLLLSARADNASAYAQPIQTLAQGVVERTRDTNTEALITVWPYEISASGLVALPEETRLAVYPNYNGGTARGGDDRLIVVLQDPVTRMGVADGFWPVIVWMSLSDARQLHADLAQVISSKPESDDEMSGVESLIGTGIYSLDHNGAKRLSSEAAWRVMPRYVGVDAMGEITQVDERLTVVLADEPNSFWPVIVKMESGVAQAFMADLARVISQKGEDPERG